MTKHLDESERAELKRLAEKATPGPWRADLSKQVCAGALLQSERGQELAYDMTTDDARYIATCSPDVVLGLLARLGELEAECIQLTDRLNETETAGFRRASVDHAERVEKEALRSRISELERKLDDRDCIEVTIATLRAHGSPLVCPTTGGVLLCKDGTWVHGKDLPAALELLERKLDERKVSRATND